MRTDKSFKVIRNICRIIKDEHLCACPGVGLADQSWPLPPGLSWSSGPGGPGAPPALPPHTGGALPPRCRDPPAVSDIPLPCGQQTL